MPFQEKSAIAMVATLVAVYGVYFGIVGWWLTSTPVSQITYQPMLIVAVVPLALVAALGHIDMALSHRDARDERDRIIGLRGERVGGYVLAIGLFFGLIVAMAELPQFYIAHALLLAWVIAEITSNATKVVLYRRGI